MITTGMILELFESMRAADPHATDRLFNRRVACNDDLAEHPHLVFGLNPPFDLGILGIVNGLCLLAGSPEVIGMELSDQDGSISRFFRAPFAEVQAR